MGSTTECYYGDDGALVVNSTTCSPYEIGRSLDTLSSDMPGVDKILASMGSWAREQQGPGPRRVGGMLARDRFLTPKTPFEKVRMAREALHDDVIGGAADTTEALALSAMSVFTADDDEQNVWNQWAGDFDMDSRLREFWRILYTDSMVAGGLWFENKSYTVRGRTKAGNQRRERFDLVVPSSLTFFDSTKITPVGSLMFQREGLAYIADPVEADSFDQIIAARDGQPAPSSNYPARYMSMTSNASSVTPSGVDALDPIVSRLIRRRYIPSMREAEELDADGVDFNNLFLLDNRFTFRHTLTKPTYQRFPDVRLEGAFPLLDLKAQLRQMDRAFLIGGSSYLLVITQGSDAVPGKPEEIAALKAGARTLGSIPLIVADHRLNVEIITTPVELTLDKSRWDTVDTRLQAKAYGTFAAVGGDGDDPLKLGRVISRGLEGRRRMMRRSIESNVFEPMRLSNAKLTGRAKLRFHPAQISLAFDQGWANVLLDLREANEISRHTMLSQLDLDQGDEAAEREREAASFDDIFQTFVPHGANPGKNQTPDQGDQGDQGGGSTRLAQRSGGRRRGGNRNGGGAAPGTGQGQEPTDPRRSRTATKDEFLDLLEDMDRDGLISEAATWSIPGRHQMRKADLFTAIAEAFDTQLEDEGDDNE